MGLCFNVFGIPVLADKACRDAAREDREDRIQIRKDARTDRVSERQSAKTDRTGIREYGTEGFGDGITDAVISGNEALGDIFGGQGGAIAGAVATGGWSALLGGLGPNGEVIPMSPVVPIAAGLLVAGGLVLLNTKKR